MKLSFQLYSAREFTPWDQVLEMLATLGYKHVEGFGGVYEDAPALKALLDKHGLTMPSGHFFPLEQFETDLDGVLKTAETLGMERLFCPALPPEQRSASPSDWLKVADRLEAISAKVKGAGLRFGWHNHDFEFVTFEDGRKPMDLLLESAPSIEWEADVAWILRGDADPLDWINKYASRITTAHVKDVAPAGENLAEDGWADVGYGIMDWTAINARLIEIGVDLFVMEHDKPADVQRFASRSIDTYKTF